MKYICTFFLFMLIFTIEGFSQPKPQFDSTLAKRLDADDYGMKRYIFVMLKTGSVTNPEKSLRDSLFKGHLNNMSRLAEQEKLVLAGPFGKNDKNYRGIFILNVATVEEAKELLDTDPAIHSKLLEAEIVEWYGSAAIMEINNIHKKIQKKGF